MYILKHKVPFLLRCFEGVSTGFMLFQFLKTGRLTIKIILVYLIHWFYSFKYHITYREKDLKKDLFWVQILFIENLHLCNPFGSFLMRCCLFSNCFVRKTRTLTYFITTVCVLSQFFQFWIFERGGYPILYYNLGALIMNCFIEKRSSNNKFILRNSLASIFFHILLGYSLYYHETRRRCFLHNFYPDYYDGIFYLFLFLFFI